MANLHTYKKSLLESKEQYIAHQCNCVSYHAAHLAADVFAAFPHANIYAGRMQNPSYHDEPGTAIIRGSVAKKERLVINMMCQRYPGESKHTNDTYSMRAAWFSEALERMTLIPKLASIAFPVHIGCGAAGGDWKVYLPMIERFAKTMPHVRVVLYDYTPPAAATSIGPIRTHTNTIQNYFNRKARVAAATSVPKKPTTVHTAASASKSTSVPKKPTRTGPTCSKCRREPEPCEQCLTAIEIHRTTAAELDIFHPVHLEL